MLQPVFAGIAPPFETTLARTGRIEGLNPCWEEVLHLATRRDFEKDAVIPHTRWRGMYYLSRGSVAIAYIAACGRERLTLRVGPGCLFNEARTVSSYEPGVVFQCLEPSEIWRFPEELLQDEAFLSAHPRQVASLLHSMGIKILIHYTFLADMGTGSRESHVCRFILNLSRQNAHAAIRDVRICATRACTVPNICSFHPIECAAARRPVATTAAGERPARLSCSATRCAMSA